MRIPSVLRRAFPRLQYNCGTSSAQRSEIESQPWFSSSTFPHRSWSYRTPCTWHSGVYSLAGLSENGEKVTSNLLCERSPACPPKAGLEALDLDHISFKKANGLSIKVWMEGWTHLLCFISCENREWQDQMDVAISRWKDNSRTKDKEEKLNGRLLVPVARAVDPLNNQFRLDKGVGTAGLRNSMKRSAYNFTGTSLFHSKSYCSKAADGLPDKPAAPEIQDHSQRAVVMALWCNFFVLSLKCGVWAVTASHVMLAEAVHSLADLANQALLAYGLVSSRRAPDDLHPYGYSKERFVWSLISAVGIFCLGSGATIVHGVSHMWGAELPDNIYIAALVLAGSMIMEGASLLVAIHAVWKGASAEGMTISDYVWRGHDPTAVAVMMEDGAAVTGLVIAALSLVAVSITGNPIYDPIGSIFVGNLLGMVAIFLIQRNRHALIGRAMDNNDMKRVLDFLSSDPVVDAVYDCKSEVIGPCSYRFKAEIDFNGVVIVQNYLQRTGREAWTNEFKAAINNPDGRALDQVMSNYGEEVVLALGSEVDRLEKEIQRLVPGIRHVDIETHNPNGPSPF